MYNKKGKDHSQYRHGMARTRQYRLWAGIKRRCYNKSDISYKYYGAKKITMSDEWLYFMNFWSDMKDTYFENAQIDRIDNSKGYSKENCRWVTAKEQSNNRDIVKKYNFNGNMMNISEISKKTGINRLTLRNRLNSGWNEKDAFTIEVSKKNKNLKKYD